MDEYNNGVEITSEVVLFGPEQLRWGNAGYRGLLQGPPTVENLFFVGAAGDRCYSAAKKSIHVDECIIGVEITTEVDFSRLKPAPTIDKG